MLRFTMMLALATYLTGCPSPPCDDPDNCPDMPHPDAHTTPMPCGNGTCDVSETHTTCPQDCPLPPPTDVCGDNTCGGTETAQSCPGDCASTFVVYNYSSQTVYYLYAWRCGTTDKGTDLLGSHVLLTNYHIQFNGVNPGCWNFEADQVNNTTHIATRSNATILPRTTYTWDIY